MFIRIKPEHRSFLDEKRKKLVKEINYMIIGLFLLCNLVFIWPYITKLNAIAYVISGSVVTIAYSWLIIGVTSKAVNKIIEMRKKINKLEKGKKK